MAASDNNDNIINFAGDFRIKRCTIISYRKAPDSDQAFRVNVLPQLLNLSFVEDLTSPVITGEIDLADTNDIRTLLPLTGMERLELKLFTPGQDEINYTEENDTLYVYKIAKIRNTSGTGRQQVYRLYFTSREAYKNNTVRVSKAFAGPIENAVYELVQDKKYLDSRKPIYIEPSSTNAKYVIPNLKPMATIKFLCDNTISKKYKNAGYLFYETTRGFNFRSFESLMAMNGVIARPPTELYAIQPAKVRTEKGDVDIVKDLRAVYNYSFEDAVNLLDEMNGGLYANRLVTNDIYNKKIETHDYDYFEEFGEYFHTEFAEEGQKSFTKWLHPFTKFDNTGKTLGDLPMQKLMNLVQTAKTHNDYEFVPCKDTVPQKVSQRQQMANFHLIMTVPGQTKMNVGNMISFALPYQKQVAADEAQKLNPYYSGRYLILQLKHKFDMAEQKHTMNMRCVKDAVATDLPIEMDELITLTEKVEAIDIYQEDENILKG